jgi:drug/metabolite transporter (DMT)-like permease
VNLLYTYPVQNLKMLEKSLRDAYIKLHLSVFLWGFTAILGRLISVSAMTLVWWRMLLTPLCLLILMGGIKKIKALPRRLILQYMGVGVIVALHWVTFYGSIKLANASIAALTMSTLSLFGAFLEPLFQKTKIKGYEVVIGVVIIFAIWLISTDLQVTMFVGLLVGIISALFSTIFSILNKKLIHQAEPMTITFLELGSGWLFLCLVLPFYQWFNPSNQFYPSSLDMGYIVLLSVFCTVLPYTMSLVAMQKVSAYDAMLAISLEPIYAIFLAWWLLHEDRELQPSFYLGVILILSTVFAYPFLKRKYK